MKINGIEVTATQFAYDGCHKIYLLETEAELKEALEYGYRIRPIEELEDTFEDSCSLRFISGWTPEFKSYVEQFEPAVFTEDDESVEPDEEDPNEIPEGDPAYDAEWSDICTAMAWIEEDLGDE